MDDRNDMEARNDANDMEGGKRKHLPANNANGATEENSYSRPFALLRAENLAYSSSKLFAHLMNESS